MIWADECPSSSNFKILRACNWVNAYQRLSFHHVAGFLAFGHKSCGNLYPAGSKDMSGQQNAKTLSGAARVRLRCSGRCQDNVMSSHRRVTLDSDLVKAHDCISFSPARNWRIC